MSETYKMAFLNDFPYSINELVQRDQKRFADLCRAHWDGNGEAMSRDLAVLDKAPTPVTCRNWMNNKTKPRYADVRAVKYIIRRAKALARAAETEAEISALQERIAELRASQ